MRHTAKGEGGRGERESMFCASALPAEVVSLASSVRRVLAKVYLLLVLRIRQTVRFVSPSVRVRVRELPRRLKTSDMNLPEAGERSAVISSLPFLARRFLRLSLVTKTGRNEFRF